MLDDPIIAHYYIDFMKIKKLCEEIQGRTIYYYVELLKENKETLVDRSISLAEKKTNICYRFRRFVYLQY